MVKTAISFALGCVLFLQLSDMPSIHWLWVILPTVALLLSPKTRWIAVALSGSLWTLFYSHQLLTDRLPSALIGQDIVISGTIISVPEHYERRLRFEFSPMPTATLSLPKKIRLNWYQPLPQSIRAGEEWQLTVRLKQPHGMMNPASFDYEGWLFQQGIGATGYVRASEDNHRLSEAPVYSINSIRQTLLEAIELHLADSDYFGLVQGLTTGIRHNINQQQWQVLRLSGTSHLLAISGLHIGLAAAIGFFCFRWLWSIRAKNLLLLPANEAGAIGGFLIALFYASMAGFAIPTQRALIMVATVMLALLIRRPIATRHILTTSLLLILIYDPLAVLTAGFWLSFSAVAIILFVSQHRFPSPSRQWLKIHSLIAFGLTPLLLLFFMQTSLIAPVANFIAVPFISLLLVPIILLASFMLWLFEPIGILLFQLADLLLGWLWPLLSYLASLPYSHWTSAHIDLLYWIPIIIATFMLLSPKGTPAKWLGLIGFMPLLLAPPQTPLKGEFWFTLLDVGQGLSAVIQTQHHTLVFDTGSKFSDNFNTGTAVVQPFLKRKNIHYIDSLIISHGDNDHIGGAIPLIEKLPISHILSSSPELLPNGTPCLSGQSWQWDDVYFSILNPKLGDKASENNLSCVLKVSSTIGSVLLTGDIEVKAEQLLIERYPSNLKSTILVAPHHGSKTSSTQAFINTVDPRIVLFPVGFNNRYHFPAHQITRRYKDKGIDSFNSADHGAISFKFNQDSLSPAMTWRQYARKIWTHKSAASD